jgi:hypothetical protein
MEEQDTKGCWLSLIVVVLFVLWFCYSCSTPKIKSAVSLEERGEYASAYEEYAKLLVRSSQKFELPKPEDDVKKWLGSLTRDYVSYKTQQPKKSDCRFACSKLRVLENQLNYLEHKFELKGNRRLEKGDVLEMWRKAFYYNQKSMPAYAIRNAETAFANHLSIVMLDGDYGSFVEGILYNAELDRSISFQLPKEHSTWALLQPGEWVIVSRVVPELADPRDKGYFEAREVFGRYAATFVEVPAEPSGLLLQLVLHEPSK